MDRTQCDWQVIEKGRTYSILECRICSRETAIGPGEKVRSEQFNCPFDEAEERFNREMMRIWPNLKDKR